MKVSAENNSNEKCELEVNKNLDIMIKHNVKSLEIDVINDHFDAIILNGQVYQTHEKTFHIAL